MSHDPQTPATAAESPTTPPEPIGTSVTLPDLAVDPTVPQRLAGWFLGLLVVGLFLGYPLALRPHFVNPDAPVVRLGAIAACLLAALLAFAWRRRSWLTRLGLAGLGVVVAAGVVVAPSGLNGRIFSFELPVVLALWIPALAVLTVTAWRPAGWLLGLSLAFLVGVVAQLFLWPDFAAETLRAAALVGLPLAVAVAAQRRRLTPETVAVVATALWGVTMLYTLQDDPANGMLASITGNPNWTAAVVLMLAPWVGWGFCRLMPTAQPLAMRVIVSGLVVGVPSVAMIDVGRVRAGFLAIAVVLAWIVLCRLPRLWQRVLVVLIVAGLGAAFLRTQGPRLEALSAQDVRLPLWRASLAASADHPWLGIGPGRVENIMAPYVGPTGFFLRPVVTDTIEHPHNEVLNLALTLGWPAALCALALLLSVVLRDPWRPDDPMAGLASVSLQVGLILAMFDKAWVQMPSSLLVLVALGLGWRAHVHVAAGPADLAPLWTRPGVRRLGAAAALGLACVIIAFVVATTTTAAWWRLRARQYGDFVERDGNVATEIALHDAYASLANHTPGHPEAFYALASLAVQRFDNPDDGLRTLQEDLWPIAPDYAHSHRLAGRAWLKLGYPLRAKPEFERDRELYPGLGGPLQWCFTGDVATGDLANLPDLQQDWLAAVIRRHLVLPGRDTPERRAQIHTFLDDMIADALTEESFLAAAALLTPETDQGCMDPSAFRWLRQVPDISLEPTYTRASSAADLRYWRALRLRARLVADLPGGDGDLLTLNALAVTVNSRVAIAPAESPAADSSSPSSLTAPAAPIPAPPLDVWRARRGTPLDRATLLAWLLAVRDFRVALILPVEGRGNITPIGESTPDTAPPAAVPPSAPSDNAASHQVPQPASPLDVVLLVLDQNGGAWCYRGATGDLLAIPNLAAWWTADVRQRARIVTPFDAWLCRHQTFSHLLRTQGTVRAVASELAVSLAPTLAHPPSTLHLRADDQPLVVLARFNLALPSGLAPLQADQLLPFANTPVPAPISVPASVPAP